MTREKTPNKGTAIGLSSDVEAIMSTVTDVQRMVARGINPDGSLRPEAIRALLKLRGHNIRALAETNGYSDPQFHQVINREYRDRAVEDIIARALDLDADRIWGRRPESVA